MLRPGALPWTVLLALPGLVWAAAVAPQQLAAVLRVKPDVQHGETLFQACVSCHGTDGGGSRSGDVPAIAAQYWRVVVGQLIDFHYGKRWDVRMEAVAKSHYLPGAQDLADVAAYVSALPRVADPGRGDGALLAHGLEVYQKQCASCHGAAAQGDGQQGMPWLAGQHYGYLLREMYYALDHRRPNLADHRRLLSGFERPEFGGVADYLSRLDAVPNHP